MGSLPIGEAAHVVTATAIIAATTRPNFNATRDLGDILRLLGEADEAQFKGRVGSDV